MRAVKRHSKDNAERSTGQYKGQSKRHSKNDAERGTKRIAEAACKNYGAKKKATASHS